MRARRRAGRSRPQHRAWSWSWSVTTDHTKRIIMLTVLTSAPSFQVGRSSWLARVPSLAPPVCARLCATAGAAAQHLPALSADEFAALADAAMSDASLLDLAGRRVCLQEPFKVKGGSVLRVCNGTIEGNGHSIFQVSVNREGRLELCNVTLQHRASAEREEKRSRGAALYAYKGFVELRDCNIRSEAGFGCWCVQKAKLRLIDCDVRETGRSTVVAFDASEVELQGTTVADAVQHAICARGTSRVIVRSSRLERAELRAIYCYHSASLEVADSLIAGTLSDETAAIQVDALRPGDASTISLARVVFDANAGGDLSVTGNVERCIGSDVVFAERKDDVVHAAASSRVRDERLFDARGRRIAQEQREGQPHA